jgi:hypothetical protein
VTDAVTVEILKETRDEIRATRVDLSERLDQTNERLEHVEHTLLDLAQQQRFVVRWLRAGSQGDRDLAREVDLLKVRVDALENR